MWGRVVFSLFTVSLLQLITADDCNDTKPDFGAPGRRISEQKCREYNWERKRLEKCSSDVPYTEYPYMGALGYREDSDKPWEFLSAGCLVSDKFVVTAAHCFKSPLYGPPKIVRFGHANIKSEVPRLDVEISRAIIHPQYKTSIKYYDIGLAELKTAVPFSKSIQPACLWSRDLEGLETAGNPAWGVESYRGKMREVIAEMTVKVLDHKSCEEAVKDLISRKFRQLQEHQICANESESKVHNCHGSGGSPLITTVDLDGNSQDQMPYAFGVSSFARGCEDLSIFTKIPSFIDWLEQTVWRDPSAIHFEE